MKTTIIALVVLHNIAIDHGDMQLGSSIEINRNEESGEVFMSSVNANAVLQTFIRRNFSQLVFIKSNKSPSCCILHIAE